MSFPPRVSGGLPLVGHTWEMLKDREALCRRGFTEHGHIFSINLAGQPAVILGGADYNRFFYMETDKTLNIRELYEFIHAAIGELLFTASPEVYYNQRPVLTAIFRREPMERYLVAMNREIQQWLDQLGPAGQFDISAEVLSLTQRIVAHAFLGSDHPRLLTARFWQSYQAIAASLDPVLPPHLPLPKFIRRDRAKHYILGVFAPLIAERRQDLARYDDIITLALTTPQKDGTYMSDQTLAELFTGLMLAGHETTAGQAAWSLIQLLQHPAHFQAVCDLIARQVPPGAPIDAPLLHQLDYIHWAIEETTRLRPSAEMQPRLTETQVELGGYTIPAGTRLMTTSVISNMDATVFPDPTVYDPLRHSPARKEAANAYSMIGFGGGVHKCIGMNFAKNEMAILLTKLLQQFDLELLTLDPYVIRGAGANRSSPAWIQYRRK